MDTISQKTLIPAKLPVRGISTIIDVAITLGLTITFGRISKNFGFDFRSPVETFLTSGINQLSGIPSSFPLISTIYRIIINTVASNLPLLTNITTALIVYWLYSILSFFLPNGATLGKTAMGCTISDYNGEEPSFFQYIVRESIKIIWLLPLVFLYKESILLFTALGDPILKDIATFFLVILSASVIPFSISLAIFSYENQTLHDWISGTMVVTRFSSFVIKVFIGIVFGLMCTLIFSLISIY